MFIEMLQPFPIHIAKLFLQSPNNSQPVDKPPKAQHRKHTHPKHHPQRPLFHRAQCSIASRTNKVRQRRIRLWHIHAKRIRILDRQVPCLGLGTNTTLRIINNQRIDIRQQRIRNRRLLIRIRIPRHSIRCIRDRHIRGNGVELLVLGAGGHYVDCCRCGFEGCVVPAEGYKVSDFEVLLPRDGGWC